MAAVNSEKRISKLQGKAAADNYKIGVAEMKLCARGAIFIYEIKVVCLWKKNKLRKKKCCK